MDKVIVVAWGAEKSDYPVPANRYSGVKGHQCMPGFLKRFLAECSVFSLTAVTGCFGFDWMLWWA